MKLFSRVLPLPIAFLCLVSFMTVSAGIAKGQSITFLLAEKPIVIPNGFYPFGNIASDPAGNLFFPIDKAGNITTVGKVSPTGVFTVSSPLPANIDCGDLYVDGRCNVTVTFIPQKKGTLTGTATINDSPSEGTQVIKLSGTGQ